MFGACFITAGLASAVVSQLPAPPSAQPMTHKCIYRSLSGFEALESQTDLKFCVTDVFTWMTNSKLKLNPSKTVFVIISSKEQREKFYSLYYYLTMTHFLKHSLEIWEFFSTVILTLNDKLSLIFFA